MAEIPNAKHPNPKKIPNRSSHWELEREYFVAFGLLEFWDLRVARAPRLLPK
jgi:hypothetical protein